MTDTRKAAIYARYSSDNQRDESIIRYIIAHANRYLQVFLSEISSKRTWNMQNAA